MMSINDFVHKYILKKKATSNIKVYEVLKNKGVDSKVGIYLTDGDFSTNYGIINLPPSRGTHWVVYFNENCFDSYGCSPPRKLSKFIIKRIGFFLSIK